MKTKNTIHAIAHIRQTELFPDYLFGDHLPYYYTIDGTPQIFIGKTPIDQIDQKTQEEINIKEALTPILESKDVSLDNKFILACFMGDSNWIESATQPTDQKKFEEGVSCAIMLGHFELMQTFYENNEDKYAFIKTLCFSGFNYAGSGKWEQLASGKFNDSTLEALKFLDDKLLLDQSKFSIILDAAVRTDRPKIAEYILNKFPNGWEKNQELREAFSLGFKTVCLGTHTPSNVAKLFIDKASPQLCIELSNENLQTPKFYVNYNTPCPPIDLLATKTGINDEALQKLIEQKDFIIFEISMKKHLNNIVEYISNNATEEQNQKISNMINLELMNSVVFGTKETSPLKYLYDQLENKYTANQISEMTKNNLGGGGDDINALIQYTLEVIFGKSSLALPHKNIMNFLWAKADDTRKHVIREKILRAAEYEFYPLESDGKNEIIHAGYYKFRQMASVAFSIDEVENISNQSHLRETLFHSDINTGNLDIVKQAWSNLNDELKDKLIINLLKYALGGENKNNTDMTRISMYLWDRAIEVKKENNIRKVLLKDTKVQNTQAFKNWKEKHGEAPDISLEVEENSENLSAKDVITSQVSEQALTSEEIKPPTPEEEKTEVLSTESILSRIEQTESESLDTKDETSSTTDISPSLDTDEKDVITSAIDTSSEKSESNVLVDDILEKLSNNNFSDATDSLSEYFDCEGNDPVSENFQNFFTYVFQDLPLVGSKRYERIGNEKQAQLVTIITELLNQPDEDIDVTRLMINMAKQILDRPNNPLLTNRGKHGYFWKSFFVTKLTNPLDHKFSRSTTEDAGIRLFNSLKTRYENDDQYSDLFKLTEPKSDLSS